MELDMSRQAAVDSNQDVTLQTGGPSPQLPTYDVASMPGFRFQPTEEELVGFYLRGMVMGNRLEVDLINVLNLYRYDPWELPAMAFMQGEREWLFFCPRDKKYPNGARPNRVTASGYWKATGTDRPVRCAHDALCIGLKKTLVFYTGKAPRGRKTEWIMNEYRLPQNEQNSFSQPLQSYHHLKSATTTDLVDRKEEFNYEEHAMKWLNWSEKGNNTLEEVALLVTALTQAHSDTTWSPLCVCDTLICDYVKQREVALCRIYKKPFQLNVISAAANVFAENFMTDVDPSGCTPLQYPAPPPSPKCVKMDTGISTSYNNGSRNESIVRLERNLWSHPMQYKHPSTGDLSDLVNFGDTLCGSEHVSMSNVAGAEPSTYQMGDRLNWSDCLAAGESLTSHVTLKPQPRDLCPTVSSIDRLLKASMWSPFPPVNPDYAGAVKLGFGQDGIELDGLASAMTLPPNIDVTSSQFVWN